MRNNDVTNIAALCTITILTMSIGLTNAFAQEESKYQMVGDIVPVLTFTFRDGVETYEFPIFNMEENLVDNAGSTFTVEGVVTKAPLLHKALDKAYDNRLVSANGYEYPMKYFDVDVDFVKNGESLKTLDYNNCKVQNYRIETLDSNDYESYYKEVGFATVDKITFECSGVDLGNVVEKATTNTKITNYGESGFKFANYMKTSITFLFDAGTEKIEFPVFNLISAYEESEDNVTAEFEVEGLLANYPLLYNAVENAMDVSGISSSFNTDFEAIVEFTNGKNTIRGFDFTDCRVNDAKIVTKADKEEGFTGKSGFAVTNQFGFQCAGIKGINPYYDSLTGDIPVWKTTQTMNSYDDPINNSANGLSIMTTFTYPSATETIEFSMFKQHEVLTSTEDVYIDPPDKSNSNKDSFDRKTAYPTLELRGIVGNYPILYKYVDDNRKFQSISGTAQRILVDIDVDLMKDGETIRGFNYSKCRPTNYDVSTNPNNEESYTKNKFALENIFDFECQGYHPNNPAYDAMFAPTKANTESTKDLRNTDSWGPGFTVR